MYINNKRYVLTNSIILNGKEDMTPQKDMAVYVDDDLITDILPAKSLKPGY